MGRVSACSLPADALLARYAESGAFTDCFTTLIDREVPFPEYVQAFYTTRLFKVERAILKWLVHRPSTDEDVRRLGMGETNNFAAWSVEARVENQLLLCDMHNRTRSWLMVDMATGDPDSTHLYFGSAVVPRGSSESGKPRMGTGFSVLKGFHKWYSKALLSGAQAQLLVGPKR